ncbi:hypothetical protein SPLC1_S060530 [Arthrospira platensis C1]|nr:hypothetical protein SPLC1_S060530 [Arthrospira platensis C1]
MVWAAFFGDSIIPTLSQMEFNQPLFMINNAIGISN